MIYLDTSVLVGMLCPEPHTPALQRWYANSEGIELVSTPWNRTELASALAIKQRTRQLGAAEVSLASAKGKEVLATTRCVPLQATDFDEAATFCENAASSLRAADALHLAVALRMGCSAMATLDEVLQKAARKQGLKIVKFA